jgi:phosphatidylserine decarboxylase
MRFQTLYEGRAIFAVVFLIGALAFFFHIPWLKWVAALLLLFCINFFRDPERAVPQDAGVAISAADGTVTDIIEVDEPEFLKARCLRVGVFLSVFDVHVNRAPIEGRVVFVKHFPGLFLDARLPECSVKNEAMAWAFEGEKATLFVRQITGAIARRIVPWSKLGDSVGRGQRFGMIRFGSRTEVYLPLGSEVLVKVGDKVKGGSSVIAKLP